MRIRTLSAACAAFAVGCLAAAAPGQAAQKQTEPLLQYVVSGDVQAEDLARAGYDLHEGVSPGGDGFNIVATPSQAAALRGKGVTVERLAKGAVKSFAAPNPLQDPTHGYDVYRPWSLKPAPCPTTCSTPLKPLKQIYDDIYRANRDVVAKVVYGKSTLGQDLVAYKVTRGNSPHKSAVLYNATQHAREWIAAETNRRLFTYIVNHKNDRASGIKDLLKDTEVWFVPIVNVDGYDYTFVTPDTRMWRKNLRDNNDDGQITVGDGVDTNRNWPTKWRFDPEGASDNPASDTYRGPSAGSEPEVAAYRKLIGRIEPQFMIDYHSFGELILYPEGWQVETMATDNPLLEALAGHDEEAPAVPDYDPDLSAELYTVNGDITDDALHEYDVQAYTVELTEGSGPAVGGTDGSHPNLTPGGFAFQDSEADVRQVFEENRAFALDLAKSAEDPDDPVSHIGNDAPDFVPSEFPVSHGDPQLLEVNAKRSLGPVYAVWRVLGTTKAGVSRMREYQGGLRYGDPGVYYHRMRTTVRTGAKPGQQVRVRFVAGLRSSTPFEYRLASDTGANVLIMAAEDYKGPSAVQPPDPSGPTYLDEYEAALDGAGIAYDVYDTDATRTAPSPVGVLSHYDAVIWYTGDDLYTRAPGQPGGSGTTKLFDDEILATRDYMNDGGNLLVTGQFALQGAWDQFLYNPLGPTPPKPVCASNISTGQNDADDPVGQKDNCIAVSNDFPQYWLGAFTTVGLPLDIGLQEVAPFGSTAFDVGLNQANLYSFVTTSSVIPDYPAFNDAEFGSDRALTTEGGPAFDPPEGDWFMSAADSSGNYQRLTKTFDLTGVTAAQAANLQFKLSYNTEAGYDFVFVEARTAGADDYVTLPDANGHTSNDTGVGCSEDSQYWLNTHPQLRRYITRTEGPPIECAEAAPGSWNAATGSSGGFQDWQIDLSAYAGKQVELSIVYQTDPATTGIGAFVDDARLVVGGAVVEQQGFETEDLGGWTTPPPPPGSAPSTDTWTRSQSLGFVDGPGIRTGHSLLWGFGLEGVEDPADRVAVVDHAMAYFGVTR